MSRVFVIVSKPQTRFEHTQRKQLLLGVCASAIPTCIGYHMDNMKSELYLAEIVYHCDSHSVENVHKKSIL